jgi:hypothetical protein
VVFRAFEGIHNLNGCIADFDGGEIGAAVTQAYMNHTGAKEQISWQVIPPSTYPGGEADVIRAVLDEKCWIAVTSERPNFFRRHRAHTWCTVNPGASDRLSAALVSADASYINWQAVTLYGNEARNENA